MTTLDNALAVKMEPRAARPNDRLSTIRRIVSASIPTVAMVAPIIPGHNNREIAHILQAVADAGALESSYVLLRLPYQIKDLFGQWLDRHFPLRHRHVLSLLRQARSGKVYEASWRQRMKGQGVDAEQIGQIFWLFAARYGLSGKLPSLNAGAFRRPQDRKQLRLFEDD